MPKPKIICPKCGIQMNYHADKIDYTIAPTEPATLDENLGGTVEEIHTCPHCKHIETRKSE